jgi:hypothetical protein
MLESGAGQNRRFSFQKIKSRQFNRFYGVIQRFAGGVKQLASRLQSGCQRRSEVSAGLTIKIKIPS